MKKTFLQGIINTFALFCFVLFAILYNALGGEYARAVCIIAFLIMISIIMYSKYILYHRQSMLYFLYLCLCYVLLSCIYIKNIEILLTRDMGLLLILPSILALIYYLIYQQMYQLYFGLTTIIIGMGLLIII